MDAAGACDAGEAIMPKDMVSDMGAAGAMIREILVWTKVRVRTLRLATELATDSE